MLCDLVAQELMQRRTSLGGTRHHVHTAAARRLNVCISDYRFQSLKGEDTRRDFAVGGKRRVKITDTKLGRDGAQMCANRVEVLDVGWISDLDVDRPARR
jgi:hypothetical protein